MIIAIGGVSRAGKTTLASLLAAEWERQGKSVAIIGQDSFVYPENKIPKIKDKVDWESPESINFSAIAKAIRAAKKRNDIVIAEGLLIYYDAKLNKLYDHHLIIEIPKKLFIERKEIDLRWGSTPEPKWYIEHIWKSYKKYGTNNLPENCIKISGKVKFDIKEIIEQLMGTTEESIIFNEIADGLSADNKHVARGPMMSAPGIRYKNKNFAFFHKNEMTFKLGKAFDAKGNGINKVRHLSPFKTKPPLKAWYIVSSDQKEIWTYLADLALDYIQQEVG